MTLPRSYVMAKPYERAVSHQLPMQRRRAVGHLRIVPQPSRPIRAGVGFLPFRPMADAHLLNLYEAVPNGAD
jgi:hypothetical protein